MERKFQVLRIIGTLWKVLAWITLIAGILVSLGILVFGLMGSGASLLPPLARESRAIPAAWGLMSAIVGFLVTLVTTVIYFLILYAAGELIYLLLAIEENTRRMTWQMERVSDVELERSAAPPDATR